MDSHCFCEVSIVSWKLVWHCTNGMPASSACSSSNIARPLPAYLHQLLSKGSTAIVLGYLTVAWKRRMVEYVFTQGVMSSY